jgi:hypothetical protein
MNYLRLKMYPAIYEYFVFHFEIINEKTDTHVHISHSVYGTIHRNPLVAQLLKKFHYIRGMQRFFFLYISHTEHQSVASNVLSRFQRV